MFFNATNADPDKQREYRKLALAYYARLLFATGPMAEEAAFRAAQCHEALGNPLAACNAYQSYARRFPNGVFAAQAKDKVATLCAASQPPS
jgi:TolA-binding protein